ncbi:hypothetical protein BaRGS_00038072, partial [Batillaria attramentaria]
SPRGKQASKMGFKMPHIAVIIGLVCIGVALIFQIVGLATTGWTSGRTAVQSGFGFVTVDDWLEACRAFSIIGLLVIVGSLVVGVLICFMDNKMLPMIAAILAFVAAFCLLIEFAVFAGEYEDAVGDADLGYSFALTIVAFLLCIAAGVCFLVPKFVG